MARKRYNAEEIIHRLREADVLLGQGETVGQVCKQLGGLWSKPTIDGARPMVA